MKGKGSGWHGDSRRHGMARKGIRTASGYTDSASKQKREIEKQIVDNYLKDELKRQKDFIKNFSNSIDKSKTLVVDARIMDEFMDYIYSNAKELNIIEIGKKDIFGKKTIIFRGDRFIVIENWSATNRFIISNWGLDRAKWLGVDR